MNFENELTIDTRNVTPIIYEPVANRHANGDANLGALKQNNGLRDQANLYKQRGWVPVPVAFREKMPTRNEWQNSTLDSPVDDFPEIADGNIGIVLGIPSDGLVDIDLDCPEAVEAARYVLPKTGLIFGRKTKPDSHWLYTVQNCGRSQKLQFAGFNLLEYRATGGQTVFPPSTHKSGEPIRFTSDGVATPIAKDDLLLAVRRLAACSLLAKHWHEGIRHDAVMAVSGGLLRTGMDDGSVKQFIRAVCAAANDDQLSVHLKAAETTAEKLRLNQHVTGFPSLGSLIGESVARQVTEWLGVSAERETAYHNEPVEGDIRFTEIGNADRFIKQHGSDARHSPEMKTWLLWECGRWKKDVTNQVSVLGKRTVQSILKEAVYIENRNDRDQMISHGKRSCTEPGIRHMLAIAESTLPVTVAQLDKHPWLLNCTNGVIDLKTGELLPHNRDLWVTKQVPVPYEPEASCPRFERFMQEITNNDPSLIEFLARSFGYSLTGITREQCFFIAYGEGANGKSTLLGLFRYILGDYADNVPVETLIIKNRDGAPSSDIVKLRGSRYVTAAEAEAKQKLAESLMKLLTGGDVITARDLYEKSISFVPEFKLWLATNHMPRVSGTDPAMWRRIHLIPFTTVIPPRKRDNDLLETLKGEAPGVLAWAVRGCLDWQKQELNPPERVVNATQAYRNEMDQVGRFLTDCVTRGGFGSVTKARMFDAFLAWAKENGNEQITLPEFGIRLKKLGLADGKSGSKRFWKNVSVTSEWEDIDTGTEYKEAISESAC